MQNYSSKYSEIIFDASLGLLTHKWLRKTKNLKDDKFLIELFYFQKILTQNHVLFILIDLYDFNFTINLKFLSELENKSLKYLQNIKKIAVVCPQSEIIAVETRFLFNPN